MTTITMTVSDLTPREQPLPEGVTEVPREHIIERRQRLVRTIRNKRHRKRIYKMLMRGHAREFTIAPGAWSPEAQGCIMARMMGGSYHDGTIFMARAEPQNFTLELGGSEDPDDLKP